MDWVPFGAIFLSTGLSHVALLPLRVHKQKQSYIEASSISQKYADLFGYKIDANQDLFGAFTQIYFCTRIYTRLSVRTSRACKNKTGLACCNLLSCAFGGVIVSGSFGRTALAAEVGGRTTLTNLYLGACW